MARHHKREKRFGPSPANGYTSGSRKWFWSRNKNNPEANNGDNALPGHPTPADVEYGSEPKAEKTWFGGWGRNKNTAAANGATATGAANGNGYGYGNSAYTGNY